MDLGGGSGGQMVPPPVPDFNADMFDAQNIAGGKQAPVYNP